jgi:HTH-type transcriptional regulator / antitoxin HigA
MKALRKYSFEPDYAVPPGATLDETMLELGMTQRDLADRTGLTVQTLNRIFKGKQPISYDTANKLELVTGTPAAFWNNLESQYRAQLVMLAEREALKKNLEWLKTIPVKELMDRKVIPAVEDPVIQLRETLRFYGVSSVEAWGTVWEKPAVAARRSVCFASSPGPTSAWIRLGQLNARKIQCAPFDKKRFSECLREIRTFTIRPPAEFIPDMTRLCAAAGVAFALIPEIKKAPWSGATEWLTPDQAMILVNLRGKGEDRFWFTFFHEAGHILHDSKKDTHIDDGKTYADDPVEKRADDFAAEMLIPLNFDSSIASARSADEIKSIANQLGICPGIVVGRFQHLTKKWTYFNALKHQFQWAEKSE